MRKQLVNKKRAQLRLLKSHLQITVPNLLGYWPLSVESWWSSYWLDWKALLDLQLLLIITSQKSWESPTYPKIRVRSDPNTAKISSVTAVMWAKGCTHRVINIILFLGRRKAQKLPKNTTAAFPFSYCNKTLLCAPGIFRKILGYTKTHEFTSFV